MNAAQMIAKLERVELDSRYAPDCRRIMRDERFSLVAAARSGDGKRIAEAMAETRRVAGMWHVDLG